MMKQNNEYIVYRYWIFPVFVVKNSEEYEELSAIEKRLKKVKNFTIIKEKELAGKVESLFIKINEEKQTKSRKIILNIIQIIMFMKHLWRLLVLRKITENELDEFYKWTMKDIEIYRNKRIIQLAKI